MLHLLKVLQRISPLFTDIHAKGCLRGTSFCSHFTCVSRL